MLSGCFYKDGIIKVNTTIRSDLHSAPLREDQRLFIRQGLLCRGCCYLRFHLPIDQYVATLARQLVADSDLFTGSTEKWIQVLLRLSRAAADFLTEENSENGGQALSFSSFRPPPFLYLCLVSPFAVAEDASASGTDAVPVFSPSASQGGQCWGASINSLSSVVNVITVESGLPEQSLFVDGYMMRKNLAHKVEFQKSD